MKIVTWFYIVIYRVWIMTLLKIIYYWMKKEVKGINIL